LDTLPTAISASEGSLELLLDKKECGRYFQGRWEGIEPPVVAKKELSHSEN
jgi:hypothetical protein